VNPPFLAPREGPPATGAAPTFARAKIAVGAWLLFATLLTAIARRA